jgi:aryl-alcohol dehydrogenase-like predicted oxidoreductase
VTNRELRTLGRTGLRVSRIGLGLAAIGRPGYINLGHGEDLSGRIDVTAMERNAHSVLDAALAGGVGYLDAARSYGKAEAFLGSWLERRGLRPSEVTVGSKWGYRTPPVGGSTPTRRRSRTWRRRPCGGSWLRVVLS